MNDEREKAGGEPGKREQLFALGLVLALVVGAAVSIWFEVSGWTILLSAFWGIGALYSVGRWPKRSLIAFAAIGWAYGSYAERLGPVATIGSSDANYSELTTVVALLAWVAAFALVWTAERVARSLRGAREPPAGADRDAADT